MYEYRTYECGGRSGRGIDEVVNEMAREGWEPVIMSSMPHKYQKYESCALGMKYNEYEGILHYVMFRRIISKNPKNVCMSQT